MRKEYLEDSCGVWYCIEGHEGEPYKESFSRIYYILCGRDMNNMGLEKDVKMRGKYIPNAIYCISGIS